MDNKKLEDNKEKRGSCALTQTMDGLLLRPSCPEALYHSCRHKYRLHHHSCIIARQHRHDTV